MIQEQLFGNDIDLDTLSTEETVATPVHIFEAACEVNRVRNFDVDQDCELSVINQTLSKYNITPTQEIYAEVFSQL